MSNYRKLLLEAQRRADNRKEVRESKPLYCYKKEELSPATDMVECILWGLAMVAAPVLFAVATLTFGA